MEGDYKLKMENALRSLQEFILEENDKVVAKANRERGVRRWSALTEHVESQQRDEASPLRLQVRRGMMAQG